MKNRITTAFLIALLAAGSHAVAQSKLSRQYDLDTQEAITGLQSLALQGGFQVFFPSEIVKGKTIRAVRGDYAPEEALAIALRGTGLRFRLTPEGTYIIEAQSADGGDDPAAGADGPAKDGLDEVVVSGTRIARPEIDSPIPLVTYSAREFRQSGEIDVTEFLASSPALVDSTVSRHTNSRTDGQSNLNLRGLGANRTLVLVNGRRHVAGNTSSAAVDVNSIPTDLIERIDIVTGGTSAVYGADAVSGVVNFVLKRDFEGLAARTQFGQSSRGDADERFFSLLGGRNFADGHGNVTVALEHAKYHPLFSRDRRFRAQRTTYSLELNPADDPDDPGIPDYIPVRDPRINDGAPSGGFDTGSVDEDGNYLPGVFDNRADFTGAGDVFDHGTNDRGYITSGGSGTPNIEGYSSQLRAAEERSLVNVLASYQLSPAFRLFGEGKLVHQRALTDYYLTYDFGTFISPDNPYIPDAIRAAIDPVEGFYLIERDNFDLGMPRSSGRPQTMQGLVGGEGRLTDNVSYEVSFAHGRTKVRRRLLGDRYQDRFMAATDVITDPGTGQPVCRSTLFPETFPSDEWGRMSFTPGAGSGCVPYNIFGDDVASAAAKQWVLFTSRIEHAVTQRVANLTFKGALDSLFRAPGGSVGFAAGAEYRRESIRLKPDDDVRDGLGFADFGSGTQAQAGAYEVREVFGELDIPLLSRRRFVDELRLGLAGRYSDYSTSGGDITWNVNLVYGPMRGLRFRGALSRSVRAPNLIEAFSAPGTHRDWVDDPCDFNNLDNGTIYREANCRALLAGFGVDPDGFFPNDSQAGLPVPITSRGNPALDPEAADVRTAGVLLDGLPVRGLSVSLDWYDVDLTGAIDTLDPLALCVDAPTLDNAYCAAISRENSGPTAGFVRSYLIQPTNVSSFRTSGLDMTVSYGFPTPVGNWNVRLVGGYLERLSFASVEGAEPFDSAGLWGSPRYVVDADLTWTRGPLTVNYGVSWFSQMDVLDALTLAADPDFYPAELLKVGPRWKHDVQVSYERDDRLSLFASVSNLTDEKPYLNSDDYPVDPVGRYFSVGARMRFR